MGEEFGVSKALQDKGDTRKPSKRIMVEYFSLVCIQLCIFNVLYTDGFAYDSTIPSRLPVGGRKDLTCRNPIHYPRPHIVL